MSGGARVDLRCEVKSSVKDQNLIEMRRDQLIYGAVKLFKEKGFHRTTTREIAKQAGFSIGTLYEYIRTKEDVLFLICDNIYNEVHQRLLSATSAKGTVEEVESAIHRYFTLIDDMSDEFVVMYQESKTLSKEALQYVLKKEMEMVALFEKLLQACVDSGALRIDKKEAGLAAHHVIVQGQMWAFRRWALHGEYTIEDYIQIQTDQFFRGVLGERP